MARPLRIEYPGAWYHVLNRGRKREKIFFSEDDYRLFLKILGQCSKLFNIEVHAYSLIPNHYHLLIHTPNGNLSRSMRHLNGLYTQAINRKYKTEGSLFKGRFKSILIEKESYLLELVRYIHRNPYRAKLEEKIGKHKWTSHRAYMNKTERPEWLRVNDVLLQFSEYGNEAKRHLDAFVKKDPSKDLTRTLNGLKWPAILGGKAFKEDIRKMLRGKKIEKKEIPQYKEAMKTVSIRDIVRTVETEFGEYGMLSRKKSRPHTLKRRAFVYVCREYLHIPCRDICASLGGVSYAAVSKQYSLASEEVQKEQGCYPEYGRIMGVLKLNVKT